MPTSTPTTIRLNEQNKENVERFSKLTNRSRSYIINEAIEAYVQDRISYVEELNQAVASIDTDPTYSAEDVFSWMKTWGTDEEKPFSESSLVSQPNDS